MNILCFLGFHEWTKWFQIGTCSSTTFMNIEEDKLKRKCIICNKEEYYTGSCDINIYTGEKTPYTFKGD